MSPIPTGPQCRARRGFRELVAKEQFLAVYPDGWKGHWNDGRQAKRIESQMEGVDDVEFVQDKDRRRSPPDDGPGAAPHAAGM
ncbi:MAG TPA: hypothetical protein VLA75_03060 [Thermoanaerobaculia bacterium]|nr:hypothetical protein [Thermoanaerobaculia bacterium]